MDYEKIAAVIRCVIEKSSYGGWESPQIARAWRLSATDVAMILADDPDFVDGAIDRNAFLSMCGL